MASRARQVVSISPEPGEDGTQMMLTESEAEGIIEASISPAMAGKLVRNLLPHVVRRAFASPDPVSLPTQRMKAVEVMHQGGTSELMFRTEEGAAFVLLMSDDALDMLEREIAKLRERRA